MRRDSHIVFAEDRLFGRECQFLPPCRYRLVDIDSRLAEFFGIGAAGLDILQKNSGHVDDDSLIVGQLFDGLIEDIQCGIQFALFEQRYTIVVDFDELSPGHFDQFIGSIA